MFIRHEFSLDFITLFLSFETVNLNFGIKTTIDECIRQKYEQNTMLAEIVTQPEFIFCGGGGYKEACMGCAIWRILHYHG